MRGRAAVGSLILAGIVAGCVATTPPAPAGEIAAPAPPDGVLASLLLVGDPGDAFPDRSPLLASVGEEVRRLQVLDRPVHVAFLGDLVYPVGVRPPEDPAHARDTTILHAQLRVLLDDVGAPTGAAGLWVPGNHDWGNRADAGGVRRLAQTEAVIDRWADGGIPARATPRGGTLEAEVLDLTPAHRLVTLDTQAWLAATEAEVAAAAEALALRLDATPPEATTVVLAHHPLRTGGSHGPGRPVGDVFGVLARAGAIVQDVQATPYRRMIDALDGVFSGERRPLLWANGHDHNVQFHDRRARDTGPVWELTTGSGSKSADVVHVPDQVFGGPWPSWARVDLLRDGGVHLTVMAGERSALECLETNAPALRRCMQAGVASFRALHRARLTLAP